jgi:sporulation protein YlmC with PRC-barrel domain
MLMAETVQYRIGAEAGCSDGSCGHVRRVVVDPVARAITHLVVEPGHRHGVARLVPVELIGAAGRNVQLRCTIAEFERLERAEETEFLPQSDEYAGYDPDHVLTRPYYRLGAGVLGMSGLGMSNAGMGGTDLGAANLAKPALYDTVPKGEVSVRRGDQVYATDGPIGSVHGLVIDPRNQHVTHVMLEEGHLWGRKEVAIPISAVTAVDAGIQLALSKAEIRDLPSVDTDRT